MTEFEAHKMLVAGEITLAEYRTLTQPIPTAAVAAKPSLKNFLVRRDATITTDFTIRDLDKWQEEGYFRFQCLDWKVGLKSWGMIFATAKEAKEEGSTILNGKSCVSEWRQLYQFWPMFSTEDFCVLVFTGVGNGRGHDGECVVIPEKFIAALDCKQFMEIVEIEHKKAEQEKETGDDYEIRKFWL
jgi:hypothetical protein